MGVDNIIAMNRAALQYCSIILVIRDMARHVFGPSQAKLADIRLCVGCCKGWGCHLQISRRSCMQLHGCMQFWGNVLLGFWYNMYGGEIGRM
jgi:hypothetical protein